MDARSVTERTEVNLIYRVKYRLDPSLRQPTNNEERHEEDGEHHPHDSVLARGTNGQRFDLRFFRFFRADLSIKKSSSFFPPLIAATSQRGLAPRPAQVSPEGPLYLGGAFLTFNALPPPRTILLPPTTAIALSILSNCFSRSARR